MGERIVYLTNSLVDEGRKNVVALVAANIYTTTTCLTTRDHLTIHPIEPIHISRDDASRQKVSEYFICYRSPAVENAV